jgi:hypothetical protein
MLRSVSDDASLTCDALGKPGRPVVSHEDYLRGSEVIRFMALVNY